MAGDVEHRFQLLAHLAEHSFLSALGCWPGDEGVGAAAEVVETAHAAFAPERPADGGQGVFLVVFRQCGLETVGDGVGTGAEARNDDVFVGVPFHVQTLFTNDLSPASDAGLSNLVSGRVRR